MVGAETVLYDHICMHAHVHMNTDTWDDMQAKEYPK